MDPHPTHGQGVGSNQTKHHQHLTALGPQPCSTHIPSGPPCWGPLHRLALIIDWTVQTLLHSASCAVCRCRCLFLGIPRSLGILCRLPLPLPLLGHSSFLSVWTSSSCRVGCLGSLEIGRMASQPLTEWLPRPGTTRPARIAPRLGSLESGGWPPNPHRGRSPGRARHAQPGSPLLGPQSRRKAQCPL